MVIDLLRHDRNIYNREIQESIEAFWSHMVEEKLNTKCRRYWTGGVERRFSSGV
jgi:hypothetical protein